MSLHVLAYNLKRVIAILGIRRSSRQCSPEMGNRPSHLTPNRNNCVLTQPRPSADLPTDRERLAAPQRVGCDPQHL